VVPLATVTTLGDVLLRAAARAGYGGPAARAYIVGRLGRSVPDRLFREPVPAGWAACGATAARHDLPGGQLWDLLLEDRAGA
jgi:hypothetical protein